MAGKAFKTLPRLLGKAGIRFSGRHDAACGTAGPVRVPVPACGNRSCASGAAGALAVRHGPRRVPSSAWFLSRTGGACRDPGTMEGRCRDALRSTVRGARRAGIIVGGGASHAVAPACRPMPRHGRNPATGGEQLVRARHGNGTPRSEGHAAAKVAGGPGPDPARGPKKGSRGAGIVRGLPRDCAGAGVRPGPVLPGRGFFPAGAVGELSGPGHGLTMPASRTAGAKGAVGEHARGERAAASPHARRPGTGGPGSRPPWRWSRRRAGTGGARGTRRRGTWRTPPTPAPAGRSEPPTSPTGTGRGGARGR